MSASLSAMQMMRCAGCLRATLCACSLPSIQRWLSSRRSGYEMVRYADDMVILCHSAEAAENALATLRKWSAQAGLELHPQKTKIVDMGQPKASFEFLGYKFWHGKTSGRIRRFIRSKSEKKFREAIKPFTRRTSGQSMSAIAQKLKPRLEGFYN
ncbi:MAG: reverse transcriptase domain-containing protein [Prosthecobacter sp.]|nr:reverse transcriptase domain-containing protein [Prosthecobacter sp.]